MMVCTSGSGRCDKSSVSGYILTVDPIGFAMNWIWDERQRRVRMIQRILA